MDHIQVEKGQHYARFEGENYFGFTLTRKLSTEYKLTGNQVVLYMAIADVIMTDPEANAITIEYLRSVTGFNKSSISKMTDLLHEKGLIEKWIPSKVIPRTTHYKINWLNQDSEGAK